MEDENAFDVINIGVRPPKDRVQISTVLPDADYVRLDDTSADDFRAFLDILFPQ